MNMNKLVVSLFVALTLCLTIGRATRTVESHLSAQDLQRLKSVCITALQSNDLQSMYYATLNTANAVDENNVLCQKLYKLHDESKLTDYEKDFYLVGLNKILKCKEKLPEKQLSNIYTGFNTPATTSKEIFYRVAAYKYLGVQIDDATITNVVKNLQEILKKNDTLSNLGYGFCTASELGKSTSFIADRIEDAIVQADEVDGKLLQFEGGLSVTALVINCAFEAAKTFNKPLPLNADQSVKFARYFLSRRSVQTSKGAHVLIKALKTLSSADKIAPICVKLLGNVNLKDSEPQLTITVVDLMGKPISPANQNVFAKIYLKKDNSVLAEKVSFTPRSSDKSIYGIDLSSYSTSIGHYYADVSIDSSYTRKLNFQILGNVIVKELSISVVETDSASVVNQKYLVYPGRLDSELSADSTQKFQLRATFVEERQLNEPISVHQCFVIFSNKNRKEEVIYIAEKDNSNSYKFDLDVSARAGDFKHKNGVYSVYLIVGDLSISNSLQWHLGSIKLVFPANTQTGDAKRQPIRSPLPEIEHKFRVPEKRPSRIVSDIFTGLCLTPLVLLLVFWSKLGINVGNFTFHPSTIGFHVGFGGILALFTIFWLKLNMFETLRLLIPFAIFTFLCGNRLLRRLYAQRIAKSPSTSGAAGTS